jgi:hypothetical protein
MATGSSTTHARGGEEENTKQGGNSRNSSAKSRNHDPSSQLHIDTVQKHPSSPNRNPSVKPLVTFIRTRRQRTRLARCCSRLPKKIVHGGSSFLTMPNQQQYIVEISNISSTTHLPTPETQIETQIPAPTSFLNTLLVTSPSPDHGSRR